MEKRINEQIHGAAAELLPCGCSAMAKEVRATKLRLNPFIPSVFALYALEFNGHIRVTEN